MKFILISRDFRIIAGALMLMCALVQNAGAQRLQKFQDYFKGSSLGPVHTKESTHFKISWVHPRDAIIVETALAHLEASDAELGPLFKTQSGGKKVPVEI